jgi:hypothetical protein
MLGAGPARELTPAEFVDAVGSDGPGALYVAGAGSGGTDTSGRFTVHEVTLRGQELLRLRATFAFVDRSVSVRGEEITGCIRYTDPRFDPRDVADAGAFRDSGIGMSDASLPVANLGLGEDCSLDGTENAYAVMNGVEGLDQRERAPTGWVGGVDVVPVMGGPRRVSRIRVGSARIGDHEFEFTSPDESALARGVYPDVGAVGAVGRPGLATTRGGSWACSPSGSSRMVIYEVSSVAGELRRLRASFSVQCDSMVGRTSGCIRYTAP